MVAYATPRLMTTDLRSATPTQLLMRAIAGSAAERRRIEWELDRRSARCSQRRATSRPRAALTAA